MRAHERVLDFSANLAIYPLPDVDHPPSSNHQLTIGDLHGNALKLLYFLVRQHVITMEKKDYQLFVRLYNSAVLGPYKLKKIREILGKMCINRSASSLVRLLGDELCDRGMNDYFTLLILKKLKESHVNFEIIFSNHSRVFMSAYEERTLTAGRLAPMSPFEPSQKCSLVNMQRLVDEGLLEKSEIESLIEEVYKPHLKLISYSLAAGGKKISIYTHAPVGLETIHALLVEKKFKSEKLPDFIAYLDEVNRRFNASVSKVVVAGLNSVSCLRIVDNRDLKSVDWPEAATNYSYDFIHGHDDQFNSEKNVYNLDADNLSGKAPGFNVGTYYVLSSQEFTPALKLDNVCEERKIELPAVEFLHQELATVDISCEMKRIPYQTLEEIRLDLRFLRSLSPTAVELYLQSIVPSASFDEELREVVAIDDQRHLFTAILKFLKNQLAECKCDDMLYRCAKDIYDQAIRLPIFKIEEETLVVNLLFRTILVLRSPQDVSNAKALGRLTVKLMSGETSVLKKMAMPLLGLFCALLIASAICCMIASCGATAPLCAMGLGYVASCLSAAPACSIVSMGFFTSVGAIGLFKSASAPKENKLNCAAVKFCQRLYLA